MQQWVEVNFIKCDPNKCDSDKGICAAVSSCKHDILEQEEPFEPPMHFSRDMCVGCSDCIRACKLKAIENKNG
jgi:ferredoxin